MQILIFDVAQFPFTIHFTQIMLRLFMCKGTNTKKPRLCKGGIKPRLFFSILGQTCPFLSWQVTNTITGTLSQTAEIETYHWAGHQYREEKWAVPKWNVITHIEVGTSLCSLWVRMVFISVRLRIQLQN